MIDCPSVGPYRLVRRLGGGDSSEVFLATRAFPGNYERRVVLKRLFGANHDTLATEAVAYARVTHPAIVQLYDFFVDGQDVVLVLEYVDGVSLQRLLALLRAQGRSVGDPAAFFIASRVFSALAAAHSARDPSTGLQTPVIHRDVNPTNVFVPWDGFAKIGDFALAKVVGVSSDTRTGLMKGTYGYMAPEQVVGERVTPKTDVYGACLVLRELLLGRPAFDARLPELELLRAMDEAAHAPLEELRGGISPRLADALRRGLKRNADARTLTAVEMVDVLRRETDLEIGHAAVVAAGTRVRPREEREMPTQRSVRPLTPPPSVENDGPSLRPSTIPRESLAPIGQSLFPAALERRAHLATGVALALGAVVAVAYVSAVSRSSPEEAIDARAAAGAVAIASPSPVVVTPPSTPKATDAGESSEAMGTILTPASAHDHRVFVDGHVAAAAAGVPVHVACGRHTVRIGSAGAWQGVDVPCGGSVKVDPR